MMHLDFNEADYLAANPDVAAAVAAGQLKSGREHYEKFGKIEGRMLNLFANISREDKRCFN